MDPSLPSSPVSEYNFFSSRPLVWGVVGFVFVVGIISIFYFISPPSSSNTGPNGEEVAPLVQSTSSENLNETFFNSTENSNVSLPSFVPVEQTGEGNFTGPGGEQVAPVIETTSPPATNSSEGLPVASPPSPSPSPPSSGTGPNGEEVAPVVETTPPPATNSSMNESGAPNI